MLLFAVEHIPVRVDERHVQHMVKNVTDVTDIITFPRCAKENENLIRSNVMSLHLTPYPPRKNTYIPSST